MKTSPTPVRNGRSKAKPKQDPRDLICDAAADCFRRIGLTQTSMDEIAQAAGVSRPTIYYYFENKDQLVAEVLVRLSRQYLGEMSEALKWRPPTIEVIVEAHEMALDKAMKDPLWKAFVSPEAERYTAGLVEQGVMLEAEREFWGPLLDAAQAAGEVRTDVDRDELIAWVTFLIFSLLSNGEQYGFTGRSLHRLLENFLGQSLRPPPAKVAQSAAAAATPAPAKRRAARR